MKILSNYRITALIIGFGWFIYFYVALMAKRNANLFDGYINGLFSRFYFMPTISLSFLFFLYFLIGFSDEIRLVILSFIFGVIIFFVFYGPVCDMEHIMRHYIYGTCLGNDERLISFGPIPLTAISILFILFILIESMKIRYRKFSCKDKK